MNTPPALRVPSVEAPSAQQYSLREMNTTVKKNTQCRVGGMVLAFSAPRWYLVEDFGDYNTSELAS